MTALKINKGNSYKIGMNEVVGLADVMHDLMKPLQASLKERMYWSDVSVTDAEYRSRDGFIAYPDNCGGLEINEHIPKCESYEFDMIEFGEWDGEHNCDESDVENCECPFDQDGEYDAFLKIWFKFEGIENGKMKFYLVASGGNQDAPYFRKLPTLFESEFEVATLAQLKKVGKTHINKLIKFLK